jgi:hypothetical protein
MLFSKACDVLLGVFNEPFLELHNMLGIMGWCNHQQPKKPTTPRVKRRVSARSRPNLWIALNSIAEQLAMEPSKEAPVVPGLLGNGGDVWADTQKFHGVRGCNRDVLFESWRWT